MNAAERETTVSYSDADESVTIWTCVGKHLRRMRKDSRFTVQQSGIYRDGTEWGTFTIPATDWNPVSGAKRASNLTDEQKRAAAERLAQARKDAA